MRFHILATALLLLAVGSCRSKAPLTPAQLAEEQHNEAWLEESGRGEVHELPSGWQMGTAREFAEKLPLWDLPVKLLWSQPAHAKLTKVLLEPSQGAAQAQQSVRAVLLLARDDSAPSQTSLLIRLERRLAPEERGRQAVEVVCANALGKHGQLDDKTLASLQKLATGNVPHPDLDVRVECALAFLNHVPQAENGPTPLKARDSLRFLIKVLRAETPAEASDPPTWPRVRTVAWPKGRAVQELTRWFTTEVPFRPDGPWQDQVDWAQAAQVALGL
ncbi:MAG: hypothetical protein ACI87O_001221 [Planctomycetota bacterium]|jgi:hypothetical protein